MAQPRFCLAARWWFAALLALFPTAPGSAQTTSTWNGSAGNWTDATRWSTNPNFPNNGNGGVTYSAVVNSGMVTLNQNIAVTGFTMAGGGVVSPGTGGPFTLTVTGPMTWNGGTFDVAQTLRTNGSVTIKNQPSTPVMNGTWNIAGTVTATDDVFATHASVNGSGVINNLAGATYTFGGTGLGGTGTFNNYGAVVANTPAGTGFTTNFFWNFNNAAGGTVTGSDTQIHLWAAGTHDGTFNMTSSALQFESGSNNTFTANSVVKGSTGFNVFGGTVTENGAYTTGGLTWVSAATATFNSAFGGTGGLRIDFGGVVNLNQPTTLTNVSLNYGGTLGGSGALTFNGTSSVSINGGTLTGTAAAAVQNLGTLVIAGTNQSTLAHNLTNAAGGVVNWSDAGPLALMAGTTVTNAVGGLFTAAGHADMLGAVTATDGVFDNYGTFTKLTDAGMINIRSTFNNQAGGTVNVQSGALNLANPGVLAGAFNVSSGATLAFSGTETLPSTITIASGGTLAVNGGTATIAGTLSVPNFTLNGGTLTGTGTLAVGNTLTLAGGTLALNLATNASSANLFSGGTLTVASGYTLTVPTGSTFETVAGTIAGPGAVVNQDTLLKTGSGTVTITAPFTNSASALVQVQGGILSVNGGTIAGTYNVAAGAALNFSGVESVPGSTTFSGPGTVAVTGGTTTVAGTVGYSNFSLAGGTLAGPGPLTGSNLSITSGTLARDFAVNGTTSNTFGGGTLNIGSGFTMTIPSGVTLQATAGTIAGPGAVANQGMIAKTGSGTVTITAPFSNATAGQVQVQAGTLAIGGGTIAGTYTTASGAALEFSGTESIPGSAVFTGSGTVTVTGGTMTVGGSVAYSNFTLAGGTLGGGGSITGSNLTLTSGTINRNLAINGTASNTFNGGTLTVGSGFALTVPAGIALQALTGTIAGPGTVMNQGTITKTGTGTVTIAAPFSNAAGAQVQVQAGTLSVGGGSLDGSYSISSGATLNLAAGALVLSSAAISGAGQLTASGAVTVAAGGTNSYGGGTSITSGGNLLVTGSGPALGTGPVAVTVGGTLRISDVANVGPGALISVSSGGILGLEAPFNPTPIVSSTAGGVLAIDTANFSTALTMTSIGGGSMFLGSTGNGSYTAATLGPNNANTFRLGGGGGTLTLGGANILTGTASATIGSAAFAGTVRITAANNYSGGTTLAGVTLAVGDAGALGSGPFTITSGSIRADGGPVTFANPVTVGGNVTVGGTDVLTFSGPVTLTGNRSITVNTPAVLAITGPIGQDAGTRSLTVNASSGTGTLILSGTNTYSGGTTIGVGTVQTVGANQALGLGNVTVQAAVLRQAAFSNLAAGATVLVQSTGVLGLDGDFPPLLNPSSAGVVGIDLPTYSQVLNEATLGNGQMSLGAIGAGQYNAATLGAGASSTYRLGGGGGTLTIPTANLLTGFNGLIVGSTRVNGTGTVVLAADQNYQGGTTVAGGTLLVNGALSVGGTVTVQNGAVLAGSGVVNRPVVLTGGTVSVLGNNFTVGSLTGSAGAVVSNNAAADGTITVGTDNSSATFGGTVADGAGGRLGLVKVGTGTLTLTGINSYSGGTTIVGGTLAVSRDAALGAGTVTGTAVSTLSFTATMTTARTITLNGGSMTAAAGQTVTINGGTAAGLTVDGPGQFATDPTNGGRFVNVTTAPAASLTSNSPNDVFRHFTNGGTLALAPGVNATSTSPAINLDGFTTQGLGTVAVGAGSRVNAANFQSYGTLTLAPGVSSSLATWLTNLGSAPLGFNGGSRTFIGTPQTAGQNLALVDLHGQNAIVAGGLFVNNGFVGDSTASGATVIADYGALVKGAGTFANAVVTQNGGKFQAGNSPGIARFGQLVLGPGGTQAFNWQINNATGVPGPPPDANNQVSGWGLLSSEKLVDPFTGLTSTGDLTWTSTTAAGTQFNMALQTLINPITVGQDTQGAMANFNASNPPGGQYLWKFVSWQGTYTGPTGDAALSNTVLFDASNFVNPIDAAGKFSLHYNGAGKEIDVVYAVPEPGTLVLVGLTAVGLLVRRRAKRRS
jgi:fibronectin-binding autotransporter adhesin